MMVGGRWGCAALAFCLAAGACSREDRDLGAGVETGPGPVTISGLRPGGAPPATADDPRAREYEGNATHIANGQRYYQWFNCSGCHFNGGGGIGPPLMDASWRYGGKPGQIYASIVQGRPNGMPSFKGKIPEQEVWEIVAYVRSLSGNEDKLAAPSRAEAMSSIPPINNIDKQPPGSAPSGAPVPQ